MISDSSIGLVLRLSAKNDASPELKKFRADVDKELKAIKDTGENTFNDLANSLGFFL